MQDSSDFKWFLGRILLGQVPLLPDQMFRVDVEFVADVLMKFPVRQQSVGSLESVGFGESLGVIEGDFDLKMAQVRTAVSLGDVQLFAMRHALAVQPRLVIEPDRVDDQNVAFPFRDRVAHPERLQIYGVPAAVQEQLPLAVHIAFIQNDDERRRLNELLRKGRNSRYSGGKTMPLGIVLAQVSAALFKEGVGPWLQWNLP